MNAVFCDGLKDLAILNGVARLEFHRLQACGPSGPNPEVQPVTELTVALPIHGLLQVLALLDQARDKLIKEGAPKPMVTDPPAPPAFSRSPNFQ